MVVPCWFCDRPAVVMVPGLLSPVTGLTWFPQRVRKFLPPLRRTRINCRCVSFASLMLLVCNKIRHDCGAALVDARFSPQLPGRYCRNEPSRGAWITRCG